MLTLPQVQETLPANFRNNITQDMVNQLNALSTDPEEARIIRDNFVTFSQVLHEGRFKIADYVRAVMYNSHKLMGKSNLDAYKATFQDRYAKMVAAGKAPKDINSIVAAYNKGLLVTEIAQRAMVPIWLMNQDAVQQAINIQVQLMSDATVSDKVRSDAANSLLTHLKRPEVQKAELKVSVEANDGMAALEAQLVEVSRKQLAAIEHDPNISANDIAAMKMKTVS